MPVRTRRTEFPLEFLYGGKAASEALVRRGMADLERELTKQFRDERAAEIEAAKHLEKAHSPLLDVIGRDDRVATGVRGLRAIDARLGRQKVVAPKGKKK